LNVKPQYISQLDNSTLERIPDFGLGLCRQAGLVLDLCKKRLQVTKRIIPPLLPAKKIKDVRIRHLEHLGDIRMLRHHEDIQKPLALSRDLHRTLVVRCSIDSMMVHL